MKTQILAILAIILGIAGAPARAQEKQIVIGVEELDYYPTYAVIDGQYVGAAREILDAFARAKGYQITYRPLPVKRLFAELLSGQIDLKFPDNPGWAGDLKKDQKVAYSGPVIAFVDGVMVPAGSVGAGPDNIKVLGTVAGFTPFAWLDRIKANKVQIKENLKMELLLKQAALKRLDGAYASVAVANHYLDRVLAMPGGLVFDPGLPHSRGHYMLSTTTRPELVAEFDSWLATHQAQVGDIKKRLGAERGVAD